MSDLKSELLVCAQRWTAAHDDAPLSRLGKRVAGDANCFVRLADPNTSLNLTTLEKFAAFLGDPESWPDGAAIPVEVCDFVHRVKGCTPPGCAATGLPREMSGESLSGLGAASAAPASGAVAPTAGRPCGPAGRGTGDRVEAQEQES